MIGIIKLDTKFPRLLGDIGNAKTFPFPVDYEKVEGAIPSRVIKERDSSLLGPFVEAAKALERRGCKAITTTCGFLAIWQKEISSSVKLPVFTSSLIQIPWAYEIMGRRGRVGVLTADASSLTEEHFKGVGANRIPLITRGMDPQGEFHRVYVGNKQDINFSKAEEEIVGEASGFVNENPDVSVLILECTNMPVFKKAIRNAVKVPLLDITTLVHFVWASFI